MLPLLNVQPIEKKKTARGDGVVELHSIFYTIQGEGPYAGHPAVFIRLAGCNLQCPGCDTDYTTNRYWATPKEIFTHIQSVLPYSYLRNPLIVFTGGEPFRQDFGDVIRHLVATGLNRFQIETNGTIAQDEFPILAVELICSPKTPEIDNKLKPYISALKYIVEAGKYDDQGLPTTVLGKDIIPRRPWPGFKGAIYLQPQDDKDENKNAANIRECVRLCMKYGYKLSLQLHKYLDLP